MLLLLKKSSAPGKDGLIAEHFIYSHESLSVSLTVLFKCMLIHYHIPHKFMDTLIIPLLGDRKGDASNKDIY